MAYNCMKQDRDQGYLLPPNVREWLPQGDLAWFLLDVVAEVDLRAFYWSYREGIKEGKYALNWTRLSCHRFVANQVRLWLFIHWPWPVVLRCPACLAYAYCWCLEGRNGSPKWLAPEGR